MAGVRLMVLQEQRWDGYTARELARFEFERRLAEARRAVPVPAVSRADAEDAAESSALSRNRQRSTEDRKGPSHG
jgi:hypothetical protein